MTGFEPPKKVSPAMLRAQEKRMAAGNEINDIERFDDEERVHDRQFVIALARGLELLRCFGPKERSLGITEMARRTGLPKPTVSRLAGTLTKLGYFEFNEASGKYSLGCGVLSFGYAMLSNIDVREIAKPLMLELAEYSKASVSIGVRDRISMVYVETVRSSAPIALQRGIGARLSLATSSMGRAFLAGADNNERAFLMDQIRLRNEHDWPLMKTGIEQALRDYQERGYCISIGEWDKDISGVGVPFTGPDGRLMAFNCGGPAFMLTREKLETDIGPKLVSLVNRVGLMMGRP
jgi:DNA-binding IclR family transcriptional regulator